MVGFSGRWASDLHEPQLGHVATRPWPTKQNSLITNHEQ